MLRGNRELWITFSDVPILAGIGVLFYQIYHWARSGHWLHLTVTTGLTYLNLHVPQTGHVISQRLVNWLADLPLGFGLMFVGVALILTYYFIQKIWNKLTRSFRRTSAPVAGPTTTIRANAPIQDDASEPLPPMA